MRFFDNDDSGFELVRLAVERLYYKRHPFSPDNKHIHHLLLNKLNFYKSYFLIQLLLTFPFLSYLFIKNSLISLIIAFIIRFNYF